MIVENARISLRHPQCARCGQVRQQAMDLKDPDTEEWLPLCHVCLFERLFKGRKKMNDANQKQVGGSHYQTTIQPWDYIAANNIGYFEGNVIKYVSRWREKGGLDDLRKAIHYLEKLIEVEFPDTEPKL